MVRSTASVFCEFNFKNNYSISPLSIELYWSSSSGFLHHWSDAICEVYEVRPLFDKYESITPIRLLSMFRLLSSMVGVRIFWESPRNSYYTLYRVECLFSFSKIKLSVAQSTRIFYLVWSVLTPHTAFAPHVLDHPEVSRFFWEATAWLASSPQEILPHLLVCCTPSEYILIFFKPHLWSLAMRLCHTRPTLRTSSLMITIF